MANVIFFFIFWGGGRGGLSLLTIPFIPGKKADNKLIEAWQHYRISFWRGWKETTTFYCNFNHKWQILLKWSEAVISLWKYQSALFPGALIISHLAHLAILLLLTFPCLLSPNWIISFSYFQIHKEPSTTKLSSKIITWLCLYFVQGF